MLPTRWLSIRKRNPTLYHNNLDLQTTARPQDFDFAFVDSSSAARSASGKSAPKPIDGRPKTSSGPTGKRKPSGDVPLIRPQTSENHKPSTSQGADATTKPEDISIGLAFGSPSHPPASFGAHPETHSSSELNSYTRQRSPRQDKAILMQSKKWKKIGTLFKSRHTPPRRGGILPGPSIGLPTGLVVLDKSPTSQAHMLEGHKLQSIQPEYPQHDPPPPPVEKSLSQPLRNSELPIQRPDDSISRPSTETDAGSARESRSRPPLPKLELDIPNPSLDSRIEGLNELQAANRSSSSLLARRSKTLENLKSVEDGYSGTKVDDNENSKGTSETLTALLPPRRLTTPTTAKSPAANKYSLFPATAPTPVKIVGRVSIDHDLFPLPNQLRRSATSPARLSPMQDHFSSVAKPEPLNPKRSMSNDQMAQSPEEHTASTDREAPWSSAHSFQSSVSSATTIDEIFFDIKSFRDSKGIEDGQFVMTRPDSAQVELARTRSKRTVATSRLRRVESSQPDDPGEHATLILPPPPPPPTASPIVGDSAFDTRHTSVNTAYFDEAIADVERLTSPSSKPSSATKPVPTTTKINVPTVTIAHHDDNTQDSMIPVHHFRLNSRARDEVSRLIPSPVVEVKEDSSPKEETPKDSPPPPTQPAQSAKVVSPPRVTAIKRVDRPIDDSPTIPQGPPSPKRTAKVVTATSEEKPPPVPKKDAKFIPLSKYAAKGTVSAVEKAGVTPARPVRAHTEDLAQRSSPVRVVVGKERSATLPSSLKPQQISQGTPQKSSLQGLEKAVPPPPNPVAANPVGTAEVAVARTVSLARKQSARVHVPGPKLAARRAEAAAAAAQQAQQAQNPPHHSRSTSAAAPQSQSPNRHQPESHSQPASSKPTPPPPTQAPPPSPPALKSILGGGHRHKRSGSKSASKDKIKVKVSKPQPEKSGKFWSKESEKQLIREVRKWEILEKKSYSPVVVQPQLGHKPGLSVGLVVESV